MAIVEASVPSAEPEEIEEEATQDKVEVVFNIENVSESVKDHFNLSDSVEQLKEYLSQKFENKSDTLILSLNGETLSNNATVDQFGVLAGSSVELQVKILTPLQVPTSDDVEEETDRKEEEEEKKDEQEEEEEEEEELEGGEKIFTVQVRLGLQEMKELLVKMEKARLKKPFLGGYRDKQTGQEYHHASAQTLPKRRPDNGIVKFERDTQTVFTRNCYQQVMVDAATQMNQTGCYITSVTDKTRIAGPYETADEYHAKILKKIIILQSHWRRWLATKYVNALREEKLMREIWEREEALRKQREREERRKTEFERRMNPRTKKDFDLLYHALEMWRKDELDRINSTTTGPERKAALCMLLEQEATLIASIGRHKVVADVENEDKQVKQFLEATSSPKRWTAFDGLITTMDTPYTLRATHLKDLYETITMKTLAKDERLDILLTLKATVREHDCKLTREIVELVDREADLLVRDTKPSALMGLRKRIATLFLQYCKTPLFNPEAAKHIKVPQDPSVLRTNVYYCRSCCQYLPSTDFELSTKSRVIGHCRQCKELDNKARAREDYTLYRNMLKTIRKTEEKYQDSSHIIFIIQENDLCYLIENIWAGQSAVSGEKDLFELILVRWNVTEHWSPWNCILLTTDEARAHVKLDDPEKAYSSQFTDKIRQRHILARNYFTQIPGMMEDMSARVKELPLPRPKERVIVVRQQQPQATELQPQPLTVDSS